MTSEEYTALVEGLKQTGIPFAEYGWDRRPETDYGVVALEYEAGHLDGDDRKVERAFEGSIDLFFHRLADRGDLFGRIESVLKDVCGASWSLNSMQHESENRLFHAEWVFQVEE